MIVPFRGKHHSERLAEALLYSEKLATFNEIEKLEKDFLNTSAGKVYDESKESIAESNIEKILGGVK